MDIPPVLTNLLVKKHRLQNPPVNDVCKVLQDGLKESFVHVQVDVVDCPNLTLEPFDLVCEGLGGETRIIEVGGEAHLLPEPKKDKLYDFKNIAQLAEVNPSCIIGAAAGPWPYSGENCEITANLRIEGEDINSRTRLVKAYLKEHTSTMEILPNTETRFAFMGSFFVSEGKPGKVLEIACRTRTESDDYISCIRKTLATHYQSNPIALGGVFILKEAKAKLHVQPSTFSDIPLKTKQEVDNWLQYFTLSPPVVAVGTIVSFDPGINVRPNHFHGFGKETGGHFHSDIEPEIADFTGYFSLAEEIIRIDPPPEPNWWE